MKSKKLIVCGMVAFLAGCSGPNTVARNVETAATINSLAGVPFSGVVGLTASAIDFFSKVGKPKVGKASPGVMKYLDTAPNSQQIIKSDGSREFKWLARRKDGKMITEQTASHQSLDHHVAFYLGSERFQQGDFGDGGAEIQRQNLEAWKRGELVVAEYDGPNGAKVIFVSNNNEPADVMLPEEWAEKSKALK